MFSYKLTVAYDGTNYNGFQRQKNGVGVQQVLEKALSTLLQDTIDLQAAGRTDAGVHAQGQVVSFTSKTKFTATKCASTGRQPITSTGAGTHDQRRSANAVCL